MDTDPITFLVSGGPVMVPIAITSLLLYKTLIGLLMFVRRVRFDDLAADRLRALALRPVLPDRRRPEHPARLQLEAVEDTLARFRRLVRGRLNYSRALFIAAPLFGLLGTVEGMLGTFRGLSLQLTHEITRTVADGVSRALITTEAGLVVAIPAFFLINWIKRESQRHELHMLDMKMRLMSQAED